MAAVVDHRDRVLGTETFPTTRHGYRLMLAWMRSYGDLQRVGVECSGSYGDPQAWPADVLARLPDMPLSRLPELLPWNWKRGLIAKAA